MTKKNYRSKILEIINENNDFIFFLYMEGMYSGQIGQAELDISEEDFQPFMGGFGDFVVSKRKYILLNKKSELLDESKDQVMVYFRIGNYEMPPFYGKIYMHKKDLNSGVIQNQD